MKKEWPADKVERRKVASLVPYARNSRTHSDAQVAQIAASIREWGWTIPCLIDSDGGIIAGHGRILAAQNLGIDEVPCMVADGWTEAQKRAYVIADNKLALNAGWDDDMLKVELGDLSDLDFDLTLTGFGDDELSVLMSDQTEGLTDPDDTPDVQDVAITVKGDTWLLGKHRLRCGDSASADDVAALMAGQSADLCFTSPPYAQQRDYGAAKGVVQEWDSLMRGVFSILPVKVGAQVLVNLGIVHNDGEWLPYWSDWVEYMRGAGWRRFAWYVWDQGPGLPGDWNGRLAPSHEFIFHFNRESRKANKSVDSKWAGTENHGSGLRGKDGAVKGYTHAGRAVQSKKIADSVFRVMRHKARGIEVKHPAVFPVALVEEVLSAYAKPGDILFEPFGGSGTSAIACENFGAHAAVMEMDPLYCDVAVRRWQAFTGQSATLEGDGRTFAEIETAREAA